MSGVRVSPRAAALAAFSRPYAEEAVGFLVLDHRREEFSQLEGMRGRPLRIAIVERPEWIEALARALPQAEVVPLRSQLDFVEGRVQADAMLTSWERACALSLLYPEFAPALPQPALAHFTLAYAVPRGEPDLLNMVDTFVDVARANGRLEAARRYWVLGEATRRSEPRWSVARNVLGWGKEP